MNTTILVSQTIIPHPDHNNYKKFAKSNSDLCDCISHLAQNFETGKSRRIPWDNISLMYNNLPTTTVKYTGNELKSRLSRHFSHIRPHLKQKLTASGKKSNLNKPQKKTQSEVSICDSTKKIESGIFCPMKGKEEIRQLCCEIVNIAHDFKMSLKGRMPWTNLAAKHNDLFREGRKYTDVTLKRSLARHTDHIKLQVQSITVTTTIAPSKDSIVIEGQSEHVEKSERTPFTEKKPFKDIPRSEKIESPVSNKRKNQSDDENEYQKRRVIEGSKAERVDLEEWNKACSQYLLFNDAHDYNFPLLLPPAEIGLY